MKLLFNLKIIFTEKLKKILRKKRFIYFKSKKGLIIFDDIMPSNLSPWRSYEFSNLLNDFSRSVVLTDLKNYYSYNQGKSFDKNISILTRNYSGFRKKIRKIKIVNLLSGRLAYTIFFFNIDRFFEVFERKGIPFVFTLYPGGGFLLNNTNVDNRLKSIINSSLCICVIVNQFFIKDYLIKRLNCDTGKIKVIHGVPLNIANYKQNVNENKSFLGRIRILFFANKYKDGASDKGWKIFLGLTKLIIESGLDISFDVIGGFSYEDYVNIFNIEKFRFHGVLIEEEFYEVLNSTHIIVSPNSPNFETGAFDGFPLATCVSAGLFKNVLLMSDYFGEASKSGWISGVNYIKINNSVESILSIVESLELDREKLKSLAFNAQKLILKNYSYNNQIYRRKKVFQQLLD
ncbi:hypothetical protein [Algoriphagus sp.]|uniref:hypothetical protein n=1 Tax=Algoriphagus sp. TaxID=1872435 RepID=UPI003F711982